MIKSFADKHSRELFNTGKSRRLPPEVLRRAVRRLKYVHYAAKLDDLRSPQSNRLHALRGDRKGQHAICINNQWRICFRFEDGDASDVEVTDYH
ncbi:MAG: type II toxin-antitoxin system RelE/ParE family toxin [Deltaproteobacteria bacterium]|nr:type II toxin-antitoxin system RelE/ParE family toxin [Deltaproteobacteria bacterium]